MLDGTQNVTISSSQIFHNYLFGIALHDGTYNIITGNKIYQNCLALATTQGAGVLITADGDDSEYGTNNIISNNLIYDNYVNIELCGTGVNSVCCNNLISGNQILDGVLFNCMVQQYVCTTHLLATFYVVVETAGRSN